MEEIPSVFYEVKLAVNEMKITNKNLKKKTILMLSLKRNESAS